jgi:hypothetical protein
MNTGFRNSRSAGLVPAAFVSALILMPLVSHAQTFFGSGGSINSAPYTPNVALGYRALFSNTAGSYNAASGSEALYSNTTGYNNTANGFQALYSNTTGIFNTANGASALYNNTTGSQNTASGVSVLINNTTGYDNTATGYEALYSNGTGFLNTATGYEALYSNTTGFYNTANGYGSLYSNTTGFYNTADGLQSLFSNTTGFYNAAHGIYALFANTTGINNTADGVGALYSNTTGSNNVALGYGAGQNLTIGSNNVAIGNTGLSGESGAIRIGTTGIHQSAYIAGINGVTSSSGVAVYINANGQLGTLTSSRRFKNAIKDMGSVSDRLMQLRPVTFRYKEAAENGTHPLQYGLIAEEVAKIYPNLVQYDKAGKPFTIYYHLLTPMLLNELQKAHQRQDAQRAEITEMKTAHKAEITALKSELASLKQSQQQQLAAVAKLTALVETSQNKASLQQSAYRSH